MKKFSKWFGIFTAPKTVIAICGLSLLLTVVFDGSLLMIYKLHAKKQELVSDIGHLTVEIESLREKVKSAKQPEAIARQARNRFDLVGKGDLIFVFTD